MNKSKIIVNGTEITIVKKNDSDYISLTDIASSKEGDDHIRNWLRNRNTVEFIGIWETIHNPSFKGVEFDTFRSQAGLNSFSLTPRKWIDATNAIGLISSPGKGGGTYAHKDIAFEFATWLNPIFKLYILKEFQRLKDEESEKLGLVWNFHRLISKANYKFHTDAVKTHLVPLSGLPKDKEGIVYAEEAELLNFALFDTTSKEWKERNPDMVLKGYNIRDVADAHELIVLSNLESLNANLIEDGVSSQERLTRLRNTAIVI